MPVCTKLVLEFSGLATFERPETCELGMFFDHREYNVIWVSYNSSHGYKASSSLLNLLHILISNAHS